MDTIKFSLKIFFCSVSIFFISLLVFLYYPVNYQREFYYILSSGQNAQTVADELSLHIDLGSKYLLKLFLQITGKDHQLKPGEYLFKPNSSIANIVNAFVSDNTLKYKFTIVDGLRVDTIIENLKSNNIMRKDMDLTTANIIAKLKIPYTSLEGLILPDTYFYERNGEKIDFINHAYTCMYNLVNKEWGSRAKNLSYKNYYQALIVASLINKETAVKSEKPIIAAVILQRLQKGMLLQIDAAVIYGLKNKSNRLTRDDLATDTPYNLYMHYGLPPTPIALPDYDSIYSALHPANTDYLYFVAKHDGTHCFSKTLAEQNIAVKKYQIDYHG